MEEFAGAVTAINAGGVVGVLVLNLYAIYTGKIVTRREYDDLKEDRDRWRESNMRAVDLGDRALLEAERRAYANSQRPSSDTTT